MPCRLLRVLSALSLLLCTACIALWIRSIHTGDVLDYTTTTGTVCSLGTHPHGLHLIRVTPVQRSTVDLVLRPDGKLRHPGWCLFSARWGSTVTTNLNADEYSLFVSRIEGRTIEMSHPFTHTRTFAWSNPDFCRLGFGWASVAPVVSDPGSSTPIAWKGQFLSLPLWLPILLLATFPACQATSWIRRNRRLRLGLCPTCAYDLRASQDRCPECGTILPQQPQP